MDAAVHPADGRQVGLALALFGLPLGLALEVPLLQSTRLQVLLLAGATERLVEPRDTFRLPATVRLYSPPATKTLHIDPHVSKLKKQYSFEVNRML